MRRVLKSSFLAQFALGFAIGAIGLAALQPASATRTMADNIATVAHLRH